MKNVLPVAGLILLAVAMLLLDAREPAPAAVRVPSVQESGRPLATTFAPGHGSDLRVQAAGMERMPDTPVGGRPAQATLAVECRSIGGMRLAGIRVSVLGDSGQGDAKTVVSGADGMVRFEGLTEGLHVLCCADPGRRWCLATASTGLFPQMPVTVVGDTKVTCEFVGLLVGRVRFVGDDLLMVATGAHSPGIDLAVETSASLPPASAWGSDGRRVPNCDRPVPSEHEYFFRPQPGAASPHVWVRALTCNHGLVAVQLPIHPVEFDSPPTIVDVRAYPEQAAAQVLFDIRDASSREVDVGLVTLTAREHPWLRLQCRPNKLRSVPSALTYSATIGDFPLIHSVDIHRDLADLRPGDIRVVAVTIGVETRHQRPILTRGGKELPVEELLWCDILGDFGSSCRGGTNFLVCGGRLPSGAYPKFPFTLVLRSASSSHRVRWPVGMAPEDIDDVRIDIP
ncbi:MAG: hypothetical protein KF830_16585 [Planctomycetes bacterium]|nr:hypothetical protein [Planctomycetota bacterium]